MLTILLKIILILSIPFVSAQTSNPQTYYVAGNKPCASDSNTGLYPDCSSGDGPWKTIMHAVTSVKPGDVVYVREGTYNEYIDITDRNSQDATPDNPITLKNFEGEIPTIREGKTPIMHGQYGSFVMGLRGKSHWVIEGFTIEAERDTPDAPIRKGGILIQNSYENTIVKNTIHGGDGAGIKLTGTETRANFIKRNTIYDMWLEGGDAHGIAITGGAHNNIIKGNRAYRNSGDGIQVVNTAGDHNRILENIFYENDENGIDHKKASGTIIRGNIVYGHDPAYDREGNQRASGAGVVIHVCSRNVIFENNLVYNNKYGLRVQRGGGPRVEKPVDEGGCQLPDGGLLPTEDILIQNNIIRDNQETGIRVWQSKNVKIYNNDLINHKKGIVVSEAEITDIKNNIFYEDNEFDYNVFNGGDTGFSSDYNLFYNSNNLNFKWFGNFYNLGELRTNTGNDLNSVSEDPLFVSSDDFHLQSGSPAINNGILNNAPKEDFDGNEQIGNPDIGAYEYICTASDLNCDSSINILDLLEWRKLWVKQDSRSDLDENGQINILDYLFLLRKCLANNF